jgi:hypothetical protein
MIDIQRGRSLVAVPTKSKFARYSSSMLHLFLTFFVICSLISCNHSFILRSRPKCAISLSRSTLFASPGQLLDKVTLETLTAYSFKYIGNPKVLPPKSETDEWRLWFSGRDHDMAADLADMATGKIFFLTSKDGLSSWVNHESSPVLKPSKDYGDWWWFDSEHVGVGDVVVPGNNIQSKFLSSDSVFIMYTFGGSTDMVTVNEKNTKGLKLEIGVAVSQDGIHWSKVEGTSPYASIVQPGALTDFDGQFVGWPSILELSEEFRMYYHTYDPRTKKFVVGLAVARDGLLNWVKLGPVFDGGADKADFDCNGVTRRHVARLKDGQYRMWYEGISADGYHSIGVATSTDGIRWTRVSNEPILAPSTDPNAWDSGSVGSPNLVWLEDKKRWRMYYLGSALHTGSQSFSGAGDGIGIAESLDEDGLIFQRVTT